MELPSHFQNLLETQIKYQRFVEQAQDLANLLELKNELQNLPAESYQTLIQRIIKPLSDSMGVLYHKIIAGIGESKEEAKDYERILIRNFFSAKKSINFL